MRVIVTGGGTGGHIYPALAIAKGIIKRKPSVTILYVGTREGMEARLVPEAGFAFEGISGKGLPRKLSLDLFKAGAQNVKALWETKEVLKKFKPDLVVGTGGYVSGPVVLTAALFGIPTVLHEQNALPGKTNQLLSRLAKKVMVTFPESIAYFKNKHKLFYVGLPVRPEIGQIKQSEGVRHFGLNPHLKTLLVMGGSRGARSLNTAMLDLLEQLAKMTDIQLLWATGTANYHQVLSGIETKGLIQPQTWKIVEYLKDMPEALAAADLCVCRAGATTIAELLVAGKPSILIPYPFAAENHQEHNARALEQGGAARVILDKELTGAGLWKEIHTLLGSSDKLQGMANRTREMAQPCALEKIVDVCLETAWS